MRGKVLILSGGILFACLGAGAGASEQMNLGDLQKLCSASDKGSVNACSFYILGVTEAAGLGKPPPGAQAWPCVPGGLSATVMKTTVTKAMAEDLKSHPDDRTISALSFVIAAMSRQFPCQLSN